MVGYAKVRNKVLWSSWSARRPVKAEVAGSSPVRTAVGVGSGTVRSGTASKAQVSTRMGVARQNLVWFRWLCQGRARQGAVWTDVG